MKIFDAIQQVTPCPVTRSSGCQCDRLERINEAEETIKAIAQLEHTVGDVQGAVKFKQKPGQPTIIKGIVKGLTPGKHGFHIHEFGDLSKGCESAGAHYNPDGVEHGSLEQGHVGDLGNIIADKSGIARFQIKAERVELSDVVGRAIVIHAEEDDLGKGGDEESLKTGNAGERVGCGVIRLREVVEEEYKRKISDKHFDRNQLPQIRRPDIQNSPFNYKEGSISLSKLKPVQSQRVKGLSKQAQNIFLNNEDRPFIVDKNGYIINGHHRYDAANMLGIKKVPAIMIDADIEDVMNHFAHTTSDIEVMPEHYFKKLYEKKLKEQEDVIRLYHGTHKDNIDSFKSQGLKLNTDRKDLQRGGVFLAFWPDAAFGYAVMGGEYNYLKQGSKPVNVPDQDRALVVFDIPKEWYNKHKVRIAGGSIPEVSFDTSVPKEFISDIVIGDRKKVYTYDRTEIPVDENFADGKVKGKSSPGRVKRAGASCKGSVTDLRAKAKKYSGEKGKMYHWCANMKAGRKNPK